MKRGVTLVTVVLTVIVITLIAAISIVAGNRLIREAKEEKGEENYRMVVDAISIESTKGSANNNYNFPGIKNPIIERDENGDAVYAGEDWYLLDNSALEELGVKRTSIEYIVNYKTRQVFTIEEFIKNN